VVSFTPFTDSFFPGESASGTHRIGGQVDPKADLDAMEKKSLLPLPGIEPIPFSQYPVAYRLSYPDSIMWLEKTAYSIPQINSIIDRISGAWMTQSV
jgi:hypothetical protein